jgi:glutathione S-transferase
MNTPAATRPAQPIKFYRHSLSGHCHRVELMLSLLKLPFTIIDVDLAGGAHKAAPYLAVNPFGQVPAIDDDGLVLADSNAILVYLALRYDQGQAWLPRDPADAAHVQRWLSVAAGELCYGPARARLITVFGAPFDPAATIAAAHRLFGLLDAALTHAPFLAADRPTLADIAMYAYTAHAPEGNVSLDAYPAIRAWLARVEALPGFVGMQRTVAGLA